VERAERFDSPRCRLHHGSGVTDIMILSRHRSIDTSAWFFRVEVEDVPGRRSPCVPSALTVPTSKVARCRTEVAAADAPQKPFAALLTTWCATEAASAARILRFCGTAAAMASRRTRILPPISRLARSLRASRGSASGQRFLRWQEPLTAATRRGVDLIAEECSSSSIRRSVSSSAASEACENAQRFLRQLVELRATSAPR